MSKLAEKNLLVQLHISHWRATKLDRKVTERALVEHEAKSGTGRFQKTLINSELLEKLKKLNNEARSFHYKQTLPWDDAQARLLPAAVYSDYIEQMRAYQREFEQISQQFIRHYPEMREQAREYLGKMFDETDYPTPERLQGKFSFDVVVLPVPNQLDPRITLSEEDEEDIRRQTEKRMVAAQKEAMDDLRGRLYDIVSRLYERMSDSDKRFKKSTIDNARELADLIPKMNISGDKRLDKMARDLKAMLPDNAQQLRESETQREKVADGAGDILDRVHRNYGSATTGSDRSNKPGNGSGKKAA